MRQSCLDRAAANAKAFGEPVEGLALAWKLTG